MAKKVLVAYDTAWGSTEEVAKFIGEELKKKGHQVDVQRVKAVKDLSGYDAILVGAPIQNSAWIEGGINFLKDNQDALSKKTVCLFTVCLGALAGPKAPISGTINPLLKKFPGIKPVSIGAFPGVLDYPKYPPPVQFNLARMLGARGLPTEGRHDWRNWDAIREWAEEVNKLLG